MDTTLLALAIAFMLVSLGVFFYQRRAKSCPVHRGWVGRVAVLVAILCAPVSAVLLVAGFVVERG